MLFESVNLIEYILTTNYEHVNTIQQRFFFLDSVEVTHYLWSKAETLS